MGRRIRTSDMQRDLEQMLMDCLDLAEINGMRWTAIRISTALDQYRQEIQHFASPSDKLGSHPVL